MNNIKVNEHNGVLHKPGLRWLLVGALCFVTGGISYWLIGEASNIYDVRKGFEIILVWLPLSMALLVASFICSVIASIKVKKTVKVLAILIALASLALFLFAGFAYLIAQSLY